MLPKECINYNALNEVNQKIFQFLIKRKNHPLKFKKYAEKFLVWAASYAGGRSRGAGFNPSTAIPRA